MTVELNCMTCGNNRFSFPERDEELVRCQICGHSIGPLGEIKRRIAEEVTNRPRKR